MPLARAAQEVGRIAVAAEHPHQVLRERLVVLAAVSIAVDALASVLILFAERAAPRTQITNFGDAAFFSTTQLLTISSQLPNPLTTEGRIIDVALELYAIVVVTSLAGAFASFLIHRERDRRSAEGLDA